MDQSVNQQFSNDGTTVTTTKGATSEQRAAIEAAEDRVFGTERGQEMVDRLTADGRSLEIRVNNTGDNSAPPLGRHVNIDPNNLGTVLTKQGRIPVTLERVLAHEFGHAVFGTGDTGPGRLLNTIRNETPIMRRLDQPIRIQY